MFVASKVLSKPRTEAFAIDISDCNRLNCVVASGLPCGDSRPNSFFHSLRPKPKNEGLAPKPSAVNSGALVFDLCSYFGQAFDYQF